ncbi:MAG: hypothetical protein U0835_07890 [Isosphaeraceae bacterium]
MSRGCLWPTVAVYAGAYLTIEFLADLPFRYFAGFVRLHSYGLSNQSLTKWLGDSFISLLVDVAGAAAFAWVPFWLIRRFPKVWWLILSVLSVLFTPRGADHPGLDRPALQRLARSRIRPWRPGSSTSPGTRGSRGDVSSR